MSQSKHGLGLGIKMFSSRAICHKKTFLIFKNAVSFLNILKWENTASLQNKTNSKYLYFFSSGKINNK